MSDVSGFVGGKVPMDIEFEWGRLVRTGLLVLAFVIAIFALTRWADARMRAGR